MLLENIDRLFFEHLRLKIVSAGYLPDIAAYGSVEAYNAARVTLFNSLQLQKLTLVDLFGTGTWENKGEKTDSKITIERRGINSGKTGFFGGFQYMPVFDEADSTKQVGFTKKKMPEGTANIEYEIRYVTSTVKMERILIGLIHSVFGMSTKELPGVKEDGSFLDETATIISNGMVDVKNDEFIEGFMRYTAQEVYLENGDETDDETIIPMLTKITANMYMVTRGRLQEIKQGSPVDENIDKKLIIE